MIKLTKDRIDKTQQQSATQCYTVLHSATQCNTMCNNKQMPSSFGGFANVRDQRLFAEQKHRELQDKVACMPQHRVTKKLAEDVWAWGMFSKTLTMLEFIDD